MKVMLTKGWGLLGNVVSEVELDNPTKASIQDAILEMYAAYTGQHFGSFVFTWEMYNRCAIINFGSVKFYGAIPDCPEELLTTPQQIVVIEKEKFDVLLPKVKEIADEMRKFGERRWMHDEGQNMRQFADRIDDTIKEFVKGESK